LAVAIAACRFAHSVGRTAPARLPRGRLVCPCGGRRVVVAFITEKKVVTEILEHLGLPTTGPPIAAAHSAAPDQNPTWQDDVPTVQRSVQ
jgi:hypothetical protein